MGTDKGFMVDFCSMRCPLDVLNLPEDSRNSSFSLSQQFQVLEAAGIPADVFWHGSSSEIFSQTFSCRPEQTRIFESYRRSLQSRLSSLSAPEMTGVFQTLGNASFTYNPLTRQSELTNFHAYNAATLFYTGIQNASLSSRATADQIDICSVANQAQLLSTRISPTDRGRVQRFLNNELTIDQYLLETATELIENISHASNENDLELCLRLLQSAHQTSENLYLADNCSHGSAEFGRHFPLAAIQTLLSAQNLSQRFENLGRLSNVDLFYRYETLTLNAANFTNLSEKRSVITDLVLSFLELHRRGVKVSRPHMITSGDYARVRLGFSHDDDLTLWKSLALFSSRDFSTSHGIYHFQLLDHFSSLYSQFIASTVSGHRDEALHGRCNILSNYILSSAYTQIPLRYENLVQARRETQTNLNISTRPITSYNDLRARFAGGRFFLRPSDLRIQSSGDPLSVIHQVRIGHQSMAEFVESNVDLIAFVPASEMPPHASGLAMSLFGIVFISIPDHVDASTPLSILEVLAHEAGHQNYAIRNYDAHSERLPWLGVNERFSYLTGYHVMQQILRLREQEQVRTPQAHLDENVNFVRARLAGIERVIRYANRSLNLDEQDFNPNTMSDRWSTLEATQLSFQPGDHIDSDEVSENEDRRLQAPSNFRVDELDSVWVSQLPLYLHSSSLHFTDTEIATFNSSLLELENLPTDAAPLTFGEAHPLTRFIADLYPNSANFIQTFTASTWRNMRHDLAWKMASTDAFFRTMLNNVRQAGSSLEEALLTLARQDHFPSRDYSVLLQEFREVNRVLLAGQQDWNTRIELAPQSPLRRLFEIEQKFMDKKLWILLNHRLYLDTQSFLQCRA